MIISESNLGKKGQRTKRTLFECQCDLCTIDFKINFGSYKRRLKNRAYDGRDLCMKCWKSNVHNHPEYKANMSKSIQALLVRDPEWKVRNSQSKLGKINLGEKNGMKNSEVSKRMGKTRSERFARDPKFKELVAKYTREAWAAGKYDGVKVGRCKWFDYTKKNGETIKCQGTWELAYAKHLDEQGIEFEAHVGRIPYRDEEGVERSYYPDFRLIATDEYVDVKCDYVESLQPQKLDCVMKSNPKLKLRIVRKNEIENLL